MVRVKAEVELFAKGIYDKGELDEVELYFKVDEDCIPADHVFLTEDKWVEIRNDLADELDDEVYQNRVDNLIIGV